MMRFGNIARVSGRVVQGRVPVRLETVGRKRFLGGERLVEKPVAPSSENGFGKMAFIGSMGGFAGSLMGLGGGFVIIPLLTGLAKFSQHSAHATSLVAVAATSLGGTVAFASNGQVDLHVAVPMSIGAVVSVGLGTKVASKLNGQTLKRALGLFILMMAPLIPAKPYIMSAIAELKGSDSTKEDGEGSEENDEMQNAAKFFGLGTVAGFSAGMFGVGGGALMVPALAFLTPLSHKTILGTSLAAMLLPSLTGGFQHYRNGHIQLRLAIPVAVGTLVGSYIGGEVAHVLPEQGLRFVFGGFMGTLALKMLRA